MLKENEAILKTTSLVVKKEKGTIASGYTVVLEPNVIAEKSLLLEKDVSMYQYSSRRRTIIATWLF